MENDIRKKKTRGGQRYLMVFFPLSFQQVNTSECTQESVEELKLLGTLSDSNEEEVGQAIKHYSVKVVFHGFITDCTGSFRVTLGKTDCRQLDLMIKEEVDITKPEMCDWHV